MARPYSQDLRDRVVNSVAGGRTCRATAALFGGERGQCREVVAALAGEWQCSRQADGRLETTAAQKRTGMVAGADRRKARPDIAGGGGRAGRARHASELRRSVALLQARGDHV